MSRRPANPRPGTPDADDGPKPAAARRADPRTSRTKAKLHQALLEECARRPLDEVSVIDLVRRAGLSRATFYLHYEDLRALAVDACADVVRQAVEALHAWRGKPDPAQPPPALTGFFAGVAVHGPLYRTLLGPAGSGPLGELLHHQLRERSRTERELARAPAPDLVASAVASAFVAVLADWLHGLIEGEPEQIAAQIWRLLISLHQTRLP